MTEITPIELGAIFALSLGLIELLKYSITLLSNKKPTNGTNKAILDELKVQNENHLEHLQVSVGEGFNRMIECQNIACKEIVQAINNLHIDLIKELRK